PHWPNGRGTTAKLDVDRVEGGLECTYVMCGDRHAPPAPPLVGCVKRSLITRRANAQVGEISVRDRPIARGRAAQRLQVERRIRGHALEPVSAPCVEGD